MDRQATLAERDFGQPTDRVGRLRAAFTTAAPTICAERARIFTESIADNRGDPLVVARARAFRDVCRRLPVTIFDDELVVGSVGIHRRSGCICPEMSWRWVDGELDSFATRKQDPYRVGERERTLLRERVFPAWKGRTLEDAFLAQIPDETAAVAVDTGIVDNDMKWRSGVGEITPDYEDIVFAKGFSGITADATERESTLDPLVPADLDRRNFLRAVRETAYGIIELGRRYAEKAERLADLEPLPSRRTELLEIAGTCRRVPEFSPQTFREAIQMVWFVQMGCILSENSLALNLGRFDRYMEPFLLADIAAGRLSGEQAQELVDCLWIKLSEWVWAISSNTAQYFAGYNSFQNLTIGGRKRDGSDGVNDVSYMCLAATAHVRLPQPGLSVRIHNGTPEPFLRAVCRLVRLGTGFPAIHNDRTGEAMLLASGLAPEDARDWNNCGCVVPHNRKVGEWTAAANVNLGAALEFALNDGVHRKTGARLGLPTGDAASFETFGRVKEAFFAQLSHLIRQAKVVTTLAQKVHADTTPRPFLSSLVGGCVEKGVDLSEGGARYTIGAVLTGIGAADAANSLEAIRKLVFGKDHVAMRELLDALASDWNGCESLRARALATPKYGNDDEEVDALAREITDFYHNEVASDRDFWGKPFTSAFMGISNYIPMGAVVGATPDGRKAGEPLTEGLSPHAGTDTHGPTAAMRSVSRVNHESHGGGTLLNIKLSPETLESERDLGNLAALIRGYFDLGAFHVQFNVVDAETLRDAQEHPERHGDLLVRVAGYSTRFVVLSKDVQDAIIARHTHRLS